MSNSTLQHSGVKGMRWGIIRNRNRPGGADGRPDTNDNHATSKIGKRLNSMKRERQWKSVLKELDTMTTKDIQTVTKRVSLENRLKHLSKSKVASKKDKEDYLRRDRMDDQELTRKVARLQAKDSLHKAISDASKEQRELGEKIVNVAKSVGMKYAVNKVSGKKTSQDDIFEAVFVSKKSKNGMINEVADKVLTKTKLSDDNKKQAKDILTKAYESKTKKSKS